MRRLGVVLAVTAVLVGGTVLAVNASGGRTARGATVGAPRPSYRLAMHKFRTLSSLARKECTLGQGTIEGLTRTIQCINNKLNKLDVLSRRFFQCATLQRITQYGSSDGTTGYSYTASGGGTPFLTTALDFTENSQTDPWDWAVLWKKSCGARRAGGHG